MSDEDLYIGPTVLSPAPRDPGRGDRIGRLLIGPLALFLLVFVLVFYVFFTAHVVSGDSMEPNLHDGERLLVTRGDRVPQRGEVIVFTAVNESGAYEDILKRIVAVPGDAISVAAGQVSVNGAIEAYATYIPDERDRVTIETTTVPPGHVFVMGDNRPVSLDSRRIGFVPTESIVGRARFVWAPLPNLRAVR